MNCPKDHSPMIVVEHERIALDYCPECRGVWFDRGELELLMELICGREADDCTYELLTRPEATTSESRRRCPICNREMRKEHIGQQPAVVIDACGRGDGLWFDGGELHQVLSQFQTAGEGSRDTQLLSFLKETLKADINE